MLTKIVHRVRYCVEIIAGVQHIDGLMDWIVCQMLGVRTPVTPGR